jgi:Uncharacterized protein family UPF0029/RWD domain
MSEAALSQAAYEEVEVLLAVYGEDQCNWSRNSCTLTLALVNWPEGLRLRFKLPPEYPTSEPPLVEVTCARADKAELLQQLASRSLSALWERRKDVILFEVVESIRSQVEDLVAVATTATSNGDGGHANAARGEHLKAVATRIVHSTQPLMDRKSTFLGHLCRCNNLEDVESFLEVLLTNRRIASATHNIMAFRIEQSNGGVVADCDDNGEHGAGRQLLQVLTSSKALNVCIVVSRWYGGIQLGPDRFKHINNVARDLLVAQGFLQ